jgi:hydrogenase maturation protein HypF
VGDKLTHRRIIIKGTVQGVGFRPHVYSLSIAHDIKGSVLNSARGVIVEAEGVPGHVDAFMNDLRNHPPPLANISSFEILELPVAEFQSFTILTSKPGDEPDALIPPDIATCSDCKKDIWNASDNHYQYPFTNCTNCGPRFTIVSEIPYDRPKTSMANFAMCESCRREYNDPSNRRFHAQPVACPGCGPQPFVTDRRGDIVADQGTWLKKTWEILQDGRILALKGVGGFHLVCDARNADALHKLRSRKGREAKPFAVMCRNLDTASSFCVVTVEEQKLLLSRESPIVVLQKKPVYHLPDELAPNLKSLGIMLPYSPLHLLLFSGPFDVLVMTSGNYSGLPLVKDNEIALSELGSIADYFLLNNRDIVNRCDDSVVQVIDGETHFFRRSRGYVPLPFPVRREVSSPTILGVGGEMKNTFCLLKGNQAFMSQYMGEIDSVEGEDNLLASLLNFQTLVGTEPDIVAFDTHPEYASARIAQKIHGNVYEQVYHHHAHLASVLAELGLDNERVIGVILDGTGFGTDRCLWGFEILIGDYIGFERAYHLAYVPLPGGETSIHNPWKTAIAYLITFLGEEGRRYGRTLFQNEDVNVIEQMVLKRFNAPLACGCGRLFDAVSAILGICRESTYEGQAAIELGELVPDDKQNIYHGQYKYDISGKTITPTGILEEVVRDRLAGVPVHTISARFHATLVAIISEAVERVREKTGINKVALSGGTFQNRYLFRETKRTLTNGKFDILYHHSVPANDGGISLGQAMAAHWRWKLRTGGI